MKTTLKFLFSAIIFLTLSSFCNAQDAMVQFDPLQISETYLEKEKPTLSPKQIYLNQTQMATDQFVNHLVLNMAYPNDLKEQCVEGDVIVEVRISKEGEIMDATIYKSLHDSFDQLVLSEIQAMKKISLDGTKYKGARRLRIPVSFSLR